MHVTSNNSNLIAIFIFILFWLKEINFFQKKKSIFSIIINIYIYIFMHLNPLIPGHRY